MLSRPAQPALTFTKFAPARPDKAIKWIGAQIWQGPPRSEGTLVADCLNEDWAKSLASGYNDSQALIIKLAAANQALRDVFSAIADSQQEYKESDPRISDAISKLLTNLKAEVKKAGFNVAWIFMSNPSALSTAVPHRLWARILTDQLQHKTRSLSTLHKLHQGIISPRDPTVVSHHEKRRLHLLRPLENKFETRIDLGTRRMLNPLLCWRPSRSLPAMHTRFGPGWSIDRWQERNGVRAYTTISAASVGVVGGRDAS